MRVERPGGHVRWALVLVLAGCAIGRSPAERDDAVFPHPEGYARIGAHGRDATEHPVALCLGCHEEGPAPSCTSCHPAFPHRPGWRAGAVHGDSTLPCAGCHVEGTAAGPCTQCHGSFPHPEGWVGSHGAHALATGDAVASCGPCHGAALEGAGGPACTTCHATYPHPPGWIDVHHDVPTAPCATCHGALGEGGAADVACSRCHPSYPHAASWRTDHLGAVEVTGEATCLGCHEAGDGGATRLATCSASCHGG